MNKELTPLEAAKELKDEVVANYYQDQNWFDERYEIIEKALKDYEMEHTLRVRLENINYELVREKQANKKKLKALEIIKDKQWFDDFMKEHLNRSYFTKEEFDLLKEVLK